MKFPVKGSTPEPVTQQGVAQAQALDRSQAIAYVQQKDASLAKKEETLPAEQVEKIYNTIVNGDLSGLNASERLFYYKKLCEDLGLNPMTKPFGFIKLDGKLTLYAFKTATEQLGKLHSLSVEITKFEFDKEQNIVKNFVRVTGPTGRFVDNVGCIALSPAVKGEAAANAHMKGVTKAHRRGILSWCGLGVLDESEVSDITGVVRLDFEGNEIHANATSHPVEVSEAMVEKTVAVPKSRATKQTAAVNSDRATAKGTPSPEPKPAPQPGPVSQISVEPEVIDSESDDFSWAGKPDRARLIEKIKEVNKGVTQENIRVIAEKYRTYSSWASVVADLERIFPRETVLK